MRFIGKLSKTYGVCGGYEGLGVTDECARGGERRLDERRPEEQREGTVQKKRGVETVKRERDENQEETVVERAVTRKSERRSKERRMEKKNEERITAMRGEKD